MKLLRRINFSLLLVVTITGCGFPAKNSTSDSKIFYASIECFSGGKFLYKASGITGVQMTPSGYVHFKDRQGKAVGIRADCIVYLP